MLADDVAAVLPELRAQAESLMVDACRITRPGVPTWDEATGTYTPAQPVTVYTGRCQVQLTDVQAQTAEAGEADWTVQRAIVKIPVAGSEGVEVGDVVTVTAARFDAQLAGAEYVVVGGHRKTYATARRLQCKEAS